MLMVGIELLDREQGAWGNPKAIVSSSLSTHQDQPQVVEGTLHQPCIVPRRDGHVVSNWDPFSLALKGKTCKTHISVEMPDHLVEEMAMEQTPLDLYFGQCRPGFGSR